MAEQIAYTEATPDPVADMQRRITELEDELARFKKVPPSHQLHELAAEWAKWIALSSWGGRLDLGLDMCKAMAHFANYEGTGGNDG